MREVHSANESVVIITARRVRAYPPPRVACVIGAARATVDKTLFPLKSRNLLNSQEFRGFESLPLRHYSTTYGNLSFLRHFATVTNLCRKA